MATGSAMEEFEHQFAAISAEITSKINKIPQLSGSKYFKNILSPYSHCLHIQIFRKTSPDFTLRRVGSRILHLFPAKTRQT